MGRKKKRGKKKKEKVTQKADPKKLIQFLTNYCVPPDPQSTESSRTDNQIKSIFMILVELINNETTGTFVDIGCGNGPLLNRLGEEKIIATDKNWFYLGIDYPEFKQAILNISFDYSIHKKCDFLDINQFYKKWPNNSIAPGVKIIFLRNVFHELDIIDTAELFHHISLNITDKDTLIIQDLRVFPEAEKGNACWDPIVLIELVKKLGYMTLSTTESTAGGANWFNIKAKINCKNILSKDQIVELVKHYRKKQWRNWHDIGALYEDDEKYRNYAIAKIDFDLQFAALTQQLISADVDGILSLTEKQQSVVLKSSIKKALMNSHLPDLTKFNLKEYELTYFFDRGNSQDHLQKFIISKFPITFIYGPPYMGKSALVGRVIANFGHNRIPIFCDLGATSSIWNIIEIILTGMGCRLQTKVAQGLRKLKFKLIKEELTEYFLKNMGEVIIIFDHFERIIGPTGLIQENEIKQLINLMAESPNAKIIITSRDEIDISEFDQNILYPEGQPLVARFPDDPYHVKNLLNSFLGRGDYPDELIEAIDRHPFLAYLAAVNIRKFGENSLNDPKLISQVKFKLRDELIKAIVDEETESLVKVMSLIRIPVPKELIICLTDNIAFDNAIKQGLIFHIPDLIRKDLYTCLGALKNIRSDKESDNDDGSGLSGNELTESFKNIHRNICNGYQDIYRQDDDPKWLREIFYHKLIYLDDKTEVEKFGNIYRSEVTGAGEIWFHKKKDYVSALWAFNLSHGLGDKSVLVKMRIAACNMRVGSDVKGKRIFTELISKYPANKGIKMSFIDSLLYNKDYKSALEKLNEFELNIYDSPWVANQFGRIYLGMYEYKKAINAFETHLKLEKTPFGFHQLSRAYQYIGDTDNEAKTIDQGLKNFPTSHLLRVRNGAILERKGNSLKAIEILSSLHAEKPNNAWIIFPLVKSLLSNDNTEKAKDIVSKSRDNAFPKFMVDASSIEILVHEKKFDEAIRLTGRINQDDQNRVGQTKEIYASWAISTDDPVEKKKIAELGLNVPMNEMLERNAPLLVTCAKLAGSAQDKTKLLYYLNKLESVNPEMSEINRIKELFRDILGHETT
ncbi:MAG: hypothetical protein C4522_13355 [Desulfobacteraceae bacterium]|nr:MAG: hypothetical protein C4522_13355 [Desulfobacteraceae bacterium]